MAGLELVVTREQAGRTVKSLLRGELGVSAGLMGRLKRTETGLTVNGARVFTSAVLREGDRLAVDLDAAERSARVEPAPMALDILSAVSRSIPKQSAYVAKTACAQLYPSLKVSTACCVRDTNTVSSILITYPSICLQIHKLQGTGCFAARSSFTHSYRSISYTSCRFHRDPDRWDIPSVPYGP